MCSWHRLDEGVRCLSWVHPCLGIGSCTDRQLRPNTSTLKFRKYVYILAASTTRADKTAGTALHRPTSST